MLRKIETQEIVTKREAQLKYRTQYIVMVITDTVDGGDNDLGYVLYTADKEKEKLEIPQEEFRGKRIALTLGVAAEPCPQIGNVVYHDKV